MEITEVIERALRDGKRVALPVVLPRGMIFRQIDTSWIRHLETGKLDLSEPTEVYPEFVPASVGGEILVLTPGRAFSVKGDRMGRGAGYYDTFFASLSGRAIKMAAAFDIQIVDEVPTDERDRPVDIIVTEKRADPLASLSQSQEKCVFTKCFIAIPPWEFPIWKGSQR